MIEHFGIGIDIIDVNKFKKLDFEAKKGFFKKIFSEDEIKYCHRYKDAYRHFAGKFALKEAVIKSTNLKINLSDILTSYEEGKPVVSILKKSKYKFLVSVTHDKNYAIAVVISEK